jgi:hypothetical protein
MSTNINATLYLKLYRFPTEGNRADAVEVGEVKVLGLNDSLALDFNQSFSASGSYNYSSSLSSVGSNFIDFSGTEITFVDTLSAGLATGTYTYFLGYILNAGNPLSSANQFTVGSINYNLNLSNAADVYVKEYIEEFKIVGSGE